ncbi:MAG: hypothetical protein WBB19_09940 [Desulforhopalus sp.]
MKNCLYLSRKKTAVLVLLVLVAFGFSGCAWRGTVVPVEDRIVFSEQEKRQGEFRAGRLAVDYRYSLAGSNMTLDGQIYYRGSVDSLDVRVLFLDTAGTILSRTIVYSSGYRLSSSWMSDRIIETTMAVPSGAAGISFSYSARARSSTK